MEDMDTWQTQCTVYLCVPFDTVQDVDTWQTQCTVYLCVPFDTVQDVDTWQTHRPGAHQADDDLSVLGQTASRHSLTANTVFHTVKNSPL